MKLISVPTAVNARRRPQQSRARQTSMALQDAFVRLLVERDYQTLTIREIVNVAGTGLGSFYEYFSNKEDLGRVCIHFRSKTLLLAVRTAIGKHPNAPLTGLVNAIIEALAEVHREQPRHWGAHYFLERQLSGLDAYSKMYDRFVKEWENALSAASDDATTGSLPMEAARTCHTIAYGMFAHAHIRAFTTDAAGLDLQSLTRELRQTLLGYLDRASD